MCSSILAMKWSNVTDFKWKSGNLVSLSCSVITNDRQASTDDIWSVDSKENL